MTVRIIGAWCSRCRQRPARDGDLCRPCGLLLRAFGWGWLVELWNLETSEESETA